MGFYECQKAAYDEHVANECLCNIKCFRSKIERIRGVEKVISCTSWNATEADKSYLCSADLDSNVLEIVVHSPHAAKRVLSVRLHGDNSLRSL